MEPIGSALQIEKIGLKRLLEQDDDYRLHHSQPTTYSGHPNHPPITQGTAQLHHYPNVTYKKPLGSHTGPTPRQLT